LKCNDFKRNISLFIDGYLKEDLKKEFEEHISSCKECSEFLKDILKISEEVKKIEIPEPSPFIFERVKNRLKERVFPKAFVLKVAFATSLSLLAVIFSFHFVNKGREEYARRYIKELYIIKEKSTGYQMPVYNVENNYIVSTGRSGTF